MFKLNEDAPGQHKALLAVAGVMIFLSMVDAIKGEDDPSVKNQQVAVSRRGPRHQNPSLSWYERVFCRGYQRSLNCSFSFYHPLRAELEAEGKRIREKDAPNGVVLYRGRLDGVDGTWEESQKVR